jgi:protein-S-isoprenylcysteine O-methyltransferase Ste14
MRMAFAKFGGLAVVALCCYWASRATLSYPWGMALAWLVPPLAFPISALTRRMLDAKPTAGRAEWTTLLTHYAVGLALGAGLLRAFRLAGERPGPPIPVPPQVSLAVAIATSAAVCLTVINLAWRGLGAPFAAKLSSRLATDWMYAWTRNPMGLCTILWLFSFGLRYRSWWLLAWVAVSFSPGWIFFVRRYEERELEIRFGEPYKEYKARTPFLWPRKPRAAGNAVPGTPERENSEEHAGYRSG